VRLRLLLKNGTSNYLILFALSENISRSGVLESKWYLPFPFCKVCEWLSLDVFAFDFFWEKLQKCNQIGPVLIVLNMDNTLFLQHWFIHFQNRGESYRFLSPSLGRIGEVIQSSESIFCKDYLFKLLFDVLEKTHAAIPYGCKRSNFLFPERASFNVHTD